MKKLLSVLFATVTVTAFAIDMPPTMAEIKSAWTNLTGDAQWRYASSLTAEKKMQYLNDCVTFAQAGGSEHIVMNQPELVSFAQDLDTSDIDTALSELGFHSQNLNWWHKYPKLTDDAAKKNQPLYNCLQKYGSVWEIEKKATMGEAINIYVNSFGDVKYPLTKDWMIGIVTKTVRHALRDSGQTILTVNGSNPVEEVMNVFSTYINGKKYAGIEQWIKIYDPTYEWIAPTWMTDEQVAELKEAIWYGDVDFTESNKVILLAHLGIDEFNAFVDRFNK